VEEEEIIPQTEAEGNLSVKVLSSKINLKVMEDLNLIIKNQNFPSAVEEELAK
jgi:hypothetical protein